MRCFLCKTELTVSTFSISTCFQPKQDVDDRGRAHFCAACTARLDVAIAESSQFTNRGWGQT